MAISHRHQPYSYPEYTPIMPWQELVKVGLQKEQQYQQGVQDVQSSIDKFTKLPMTRQVGKDYMNNKLEELTGVINKYASEDFSNPDVISQLSRLGDPITKDTTIINEVAGSNEINRRNEIIKSLKPEQRNAANDAYFTYDMYDWSNSTDLKASLSSGKEYKQYQDLSKKGIDVLKIQKDRANKESYDSVTGGYIVTTKTEGQKSKEFQDMFMASLTAAEKEQLHIDAWYDGKVKGPQEAYNLYNKNYQEVVDATAERIPTLEAEIAALQDLSAKTKGADPNTESKLEQAKFDLAQVKVGNSVASKKLSMGYTPETLPEGEYSEMYLTNYLNNLGNAYQYRQVEQTIKSDPTWVAEMHEKNANSRNYQNNQVKLQIAREAQYGEETRANKKEEVDKLAEKYKDVKALVDNTSFNTNGHIYQVINKNGATLGDVIGSELAGDYLDKDNNVVRGTGTLQEAAEKVFNSPEGSGEYKAILETVFKGDNDAYANMRQKAKYLKQLTGYKPEQEFTVVFKYPGHSITREGMSLKNLMTTKGSANLLPYIEKIYAYEDVKPVKGTEDKPYKYPINTFSNVQKVKE